MNEVGVANCVRDPYVYISLINPHEGGVIQSLRLMLSIGWIKSIEVSSRVFHTYLLLGT